MTFWKCYYHLIWATRQRQPSIDDERGRIIRAITVDACLDSGVLIHGIGMVPDHVHMVVSIPPKLAVSEVVQRIKGASSRALGKRNQGIDDGWQGWQQEYGVLSFGERSLAQVVEYVCNQEVHHGAGTLLAPFERIDKDRDG